MRFTEMVSGKGNAINVAVEDELDGEDVIVRVKLSYKYLDGFILVQSPPSVLQSNSHKTRIVNSFLQYFLNNFEEFSQTHFILQEEMEEVHDDNKT